MKVKASSELGELLRRAVIALEAMAATHNAEERRKHNLWLLGESIVDSGATEAVSARDGEMSVDERGNSWPPAVRGHDWQHDELSGWYLEPSSETVDSEAIGEASGTMQLDVGADDAPWSGRERRNWFRFSRRNGDAERRQGDDRRVTPRNFDDHESRRLMSRRQSDYIADCRPRRLVGDDLHGRRQSGDEQVVADLIGEKFDDLVGDFFDEAETPQQREERRSAPRNRRGETEQRMRTRRRPHDRRKRVKPGWMDEQRRGDERRLRFSEGRRRADLDASYERRFNDGRRDED